MKVCLEVCLYVYMHVFVYGNLRPDNGTNEPLKQWMSKF